jgi:hypothetical protein
MSWSDNLAAANPADPGGTYIVGAVGSAIMSANAGGFVTTLTASAISGATSLTVASIAGITSGQNLNLILANGLRYTATVASTPSGTTVPLTAGIPSAANNGALVMATAGETQGLYVVGNINSTTAYADHNIGAEFSEYSSTGATYASGWDIGCQNNTPMNSAGYLYDACLRMGSAGGAGEKMTVGFLTTDDSGAWPLSATANWAQIGGVTTTDSTHTLGGGLIFDVPISGNALQWNRGADYLTGAGNASLQALTLSGHLAYTQATPPAISGCTGCSLDAQASDSAGTLTEGTSQTGAVITFATPYATVPHCAVTPNTALAQAAFTSASCSTTALTIVNGAMTGNGFTYNVSQ